MTIDKYSSGIVSIRELAKLSSVSSETLRHYDRLMILFKRGLYVKENIFHHIKLLGMKRNWHMKL